MLNGWKAARVVHANPDKGWWIAETIEPEKQAIFLWVGKAATLRLEGSQLVPMKMEKQNVIPLEKGVTIAFWGLLPPQEGARYPQAEFWADPAHLEEMVAKLEPARAKAAATQAELAAEIAATEAKRQAAMERAERKRHGSGGGKQGGKGQKQNGKKGRRAA